MPGYAGLSGSALLPSSHSRPGIPGTTSNRAGALATAAASAPVEATWLAWPAFLPLLRALDGLDPRRSALVGWAWSLGTNVALFTWLGVATGRFGQIGRAHV